MNQEWANLTRKKKIDVLKLDRRIREDEIIINLKTDRSGKMAAIPKGNYLKMGLVDTEKDMKMDRENVRKKETLINCHTRFLIKGYNIGESHCNLQ